MLQVDDDNSVYLEAVTLSGCEEGPGICALLLTVVSLLLILLALPLSLVCVVKVVQVDYLIFFSILICFLSSAEELTQYYQNNWIPVSQ